MHSLELNKIYTVDEYFALEESGEEHHEYNNGNLIKIITGCSILHLLPSRLTIKFGKMLYGLRIYFYSFIGFS